MVYDSDIKKHINYVHVSDFSGLWPDIGGMLSMIETPGANDEARSLMAELERLQCEMVTLARENDVLRSEINFLKQAAEYFYKESLEAKR